MIETVFLILGVAFSALVYHISIRPANISAGRKALYLILSAIGIAGMMFLFGIMTAFVMNGMQ